MRRVFWTALLLRALLLASAIRAGGPSVVRLADSPEYLDLATSLLSEGRFGSPEPELLRLPGYPLLLVPGVALGQPVAVALVLQTLLGSFTALLAYSLARQLGGERAALWAGLACACEPVSLAWGGVLMAESLLTACVAASVCCAVRFSLHGSTRLLLGACFLSSAAAYVKPVAFLFPIWLGLLLVAWALASRGARPRLRPALGFLVLASALLSVWPVRNGLVAGFWGFSRQLEHVSAAAAFRVATTATTASSREQREALRQEYLPEGARRGVLDEATSSRVSTTLRAQPLRLLRLQLEGTLRTLFQPGALPFLELFGASRRDPELRLLIANAGPEAAAAHVVRHAPALAALWLVLLTWNAAYMALAALALARGVPERGLALLVAAAALYFALAGGGPWAQSRFRHPLMPLVSALAGCSLAAGISGRAARARQPARSEGAP